jgi:hypothetical protein
VPGTDTDLPAQPLTYSLGAGAPAGAGVSAGGLFTWTPVAGQDGITHTITVIVTDGGTPALSGTNRFRVTVAPGALTRPTLVNPTRDEAGFTTFVQTINGRTYYLERTRSLDTIAWQIVDQLIGNGGVILLNDPAPTGSQNFYRARVE